VLTCKGHPAGSHGLMEIRCSDDIFITNESSSLKKDAFFSV